MKKAIMLVAILMFMQNAAKADSLDRALNASTIYGGVGTATGVANTYSDVATNASVRKNIDAQTALIKMQAAQNGINLYTTADSVNSRMFLHNESVYFVQDARRLAKVEGDTEMLNLINKYKKAGKIICAAKIRELLNKRQGIQPIKNVATKNIVENSNKTTAVFVRNIDAQTENIKNNRDLQIVRQPDGTAKVYQNGVEVKTTADPNSPEYKMGLNMATSIADYMERKNAQAKLKQIKAVAKIEKDTKTLELIKKYKKAGAIVTLEKIEEQEKHGK